jgi:hypothetical protein
LPYSIPPVSPVSREFKISDQLRGNPHDGPEVTAMPGSKIRSQYLVFIQPLNSL